MNWSNNFLVITNSILVFIVYPWICLFEISNGKATKEILVVSSFEFPLEAYVLFEDILKVQYFTCMPKSRSNLILILLEVSSPMQTFISLLKK